MQRSVQLPGYKPWSQPWWLSLARCRKQGGWTMWPLRSLKHGANDWPRSNAYSWSHQPHEVTEVGRGHGGGKRSSWGEEERRLKANENEPNSPCRHVKACSGWRIISWAQENLKSKSWVPGHSVADARSLQYPQLVLSLHRRALSSQPWPIAVFPPSQPMDLCLSSPTLCVVNW